MSCLATTVIQSALLTQQSTVGKAAKLQKHSKPVKCEMASDVIDIVTEKKSEESIQCNRCFAMGL